MKIYLVVNDWATEDASDVSITVFDMPEKAKKEFEKQKFEERCECWDKAFNGEEIADGYCLDENDFLFEIWEDGCYVTSHTRIQIIEKEVN